MMTAAKVMLLVVCGSPLAVCFCWAFWAAATDPHFSYPAVDFED